VTDAVSIRIGDQTREVRFSLRAVAAAERLLGGEDIQFVTLTKLSLPNLCKIAAAGLSEHKQGGKKVSPPQVEDWLIREPTKVPELRRAVVLAVSLHLKEIGEVEPEDARLLGEALASAAPASAGAPISASADGSGSTPKEPGT
jgi:hypothetical protein